MSLPISVFRDLHRIHRQLTDLRERFSRGPKLVQAAELTVKRAEDEVAKGKEVLKQARKVAHEKELQLKEREARIKDVQRKLNEAQSNREYSAFKEQIAADLQANSVLSDEILEVLDKSEGYQKVIVDAEVVVTKQKDELAKVKQRVEGERGSIDFDINRLTDELKVVEENLPPDFKKEYDRLVKARGENAMAQVDGDVCGGCFSMITPQMANELRLAKPMFCKSCGRLLYLPE